MSRTSQCGEDTGGESWEAFLSRTRRSPAMLELTSAAQIFEKFRATDDLGLIFASFSSLFALATAESATARSGVPPWAKPQEIQDTPWRYPYEKIRVLLGGNWKAKQLWEKLDKRTGRSEYVAAPCTQGRLMGRRTVVVGAGPVGLRAAIELRLLGASVTVVEKRVSFTRINQLHLWSWCGEEIKELGARTLEPPPQDFGANADKLNIGIGELQTLLLKTALLLGVEVLLGAEFAGVESGTGDWAVRLAPPRSLSGELPSPGAPHMMRGVGALVAADGLGGHVGSSLGFEGSEVGCLRNEEAIGLVCNFSTTGSAGERGLRSFSMARQFFEAKFKALTASTGAELENIVYVKAKASHYFVMTPTRRCLISTGVVKDAARSPLLAADNIDRSALDALARGIVSFHFKEEPTLPEANATPDQNAAETARSMPYADNGPQLFDFSKLHRCSDGIRFLDPTGQNDREDTEALLVAIVGDCLIEPFWPEGLGIMRGFFGALDMASAVGLWAEGTGREKVRAHFASTYIQLKTLARSTQTAMLRDEKRFALAPETRYKCLT